MKKISQLLFVFLLSTPLFSQTLFTYGSQAVSKDEFLRAYNKNNTSPTDKTTSLRDYLDLYTRFKLKVKAAFDEHLDTLPNIISDLQNFRSQVEEGYLDDEKEVTALVDEAFARSQKDIHVQYIFIPLDKSATATDTAKIYKEVQNAYGSLLKDGSLSGAVKALQQQSVTSSTADAGFITVFSLPYQFENIVYHLKPGEISRPHRSSNGYYLFKNIDERKAEGKIKVAQVLVAQPPDEEGSNKTLLLADSVYRLLRSGADFAETAKEFSNDNNTYMAGGVMPEFGTGKYDSVFESRAFLLQKENDLSVPFKTALGYHILKLIGKTAVPADKNDATYLASLKEQVVQDPRISVAKEKFNTTLLTVLNYKKIPGINYDKLWQLTDSSLKGKTLSSPGLTPKSPLFSFNTIHFSVANWLSFAKQNRPGSTQPGAAVYPDLMKTFISSSAAEYYRKRLETYSPEFRYQLEEFKEGNMLFEIMERNIWSKASADSTGLLNFYSRHKTDYNWKESADIILITCANEKLATSIAEQVRAGKSWHQLVDDNSVQVQSDSGRYELSQVPVITGAKLTAGTITDPTVNAADGTASFVIVSKTYPADEQRSFEEARGLVINDYQNLLEDEWVTSLKKKYPVTINETVYQSLEKAGEK